MLCVTSVNIYMHVFYDFVVNLLSDYFVSSLTLSVIADIHYFHEI